MIKRLFYNYFIVITVTILFTVMTTSLIIQKEVVRQVTDNTISELVLLRSFFEDIENYEDSTIIAFVQKYRAEKLQHVAVINDRGRLIVDSEGESEIENKEYYKLAFQAFKTNEIQVKQVNIYKGKKIILTLLAPVQNEKFKGIMKMTVETEILGVLIDYISIFLVISIAFGFFIAKWSANSYGENVVKPITNLTAAAKAITVGEYQEKIYSTQKNELGLLSNAFNEMTSSLTNATVTLESKNSELKSVLKSMNHGIVVIDNDMRISIKNRRFIELFNLENDNIEGELFFKITRNLAVFDVFEKSKEKKEVVHRETKFKKNEDEYIYMLSANPIRSVSDPNVVIGTLLVVQDVTEVRKLETIRTDFVSNVTHELKTPLTSIKGFVETLSDGAINDPKVAGRFLDIIHIEAERLELLINDILILSEIEALGSDSKIGTENIELILEESIEILLPKADEKGIGLITEIEEDIRFFKCNKNRIKQIFINLISNAIKYTEEGYVKVFLKECNKNLVFIIEDTGIGIDEEHIPRLFERFYRVDKGRSRKQGGTGLGLSIVKHIVELYNGIINVESQLGKGSRIIIYLPYSK